MWKHVHAQAGGACCFYRLLWYCGVAWLRSVTDTLFASGMHDGASMVCGCALQLLGRWLFCYESLAWHWLAGGDAFVALRACSTWRRVVHCAALWFCHLMGPLRAVLRGGHGERRLGLLAVPCGTLLMAVLRFLSMWPQGWERRCGFGFFGAASVALPRDGSLCAPLLMGRRLAGCGLVARCDSVRHPWGVGLPHVCPFFFCLFSLPPDFLPTPAAG